MIGTRNGRFLVNPKLESPSDIYPKVLIDVVNPNNVLLINSYAELQSVQDFKNKGLLEPIYKGWGLAYDILIGKSGDSSFLVSYSNLTGKEDSEVPPTTTSPVFEGRFRSFDGQISSFEVFDSESYGEAANHRRRTQYVQGYNLTNRLLAVRDVKLGIDLDN